MDLNDFVLNFFRGSTQWTARRSAVKTHPVEQGFHPADTELSRGRGVDGNEGALEAACPLDVSLLKGFV
jgi:hypothetical protein